MSASWRTRSRAVVVSETTTLDASHFPLLSAAPATSPGLAPLDEQIEVERLTPYPLAPAQPVSAQPLSASSMVGHEIPIAPAPPAAQLNLLRPDGEVRPIEEIESEAIKFAIAHYRGQMSEVARRLKIGRSTLYRKLETIDAATAD